MPVVQVLAVAVAYTTVVGTAVSMHPRRHRANRFSPLQATALATSDTETTGRIHVLEMGQPVRIYDLAEQMIRLAGLQPFTDIDIEIIGLRPGEKLYEELLHDNEALLTTSNPGLLLAEARTGEIKSLRNTIDLLAESARNRRREDTLNLIQTLVPEYQPKKNAAAADT